MVEQALEAGLPGVLFRDKDLPPDQAGELAEPIRRAARRRGALFYVAERAQMARRLEADGLHLGEGSLRPATGLWDGPLSVAAHDRQGLERAGSLGARFALLSPLFATRSHPGGPHLGPERFRELAEYAPVPVLALGGVTPANAGRALAAGAAGVACMDAVLAADDPAAAVRAFLDVLGEGG